MGSVAHGRVAAFFDIDGTLVPKPSLERRFVALLAWRRELSAVNSVRWILEALRLAPRGGSAIRHGNKMHLRGVRAGLDGDGGLRFVVPGFFPRAVERVAQHAAAGHDIVLVSGTLAPLAKMLSVALEAGLKRLGCPASVRVCATRLEESYGAWTGRVLGGPMMGKAKAQAALRLAQENGYDLGRSYAYADSASDRWLLAMVGNPAAVNPAWRLARIARARSWPVLRWSVAPRNEAARPREAGSCEMSLRKHASKAI